MKPSVPEPLALWVLGPPGPQRVRATQALMSLGIYTVFASIQHLEVLLGLVPEAQSWALSAFYLGGALAFYAVIRSGLNLRWPGDPSMTRVQMTFALVALSWSYGITGPARGAVMAIVMLVILYGMFGLPASQARALSMAGFVLMGGVMIFKALTDPEHYDPRVEFFHLVFAATVMAAVSVLSIRLGRMRERLRAQKQALEDALARIRDLATRDPLTGLLNRRAMTESLQPLLAGGGTLALMDLDHFKRLNDGHGHAAGDAALRGFGEVARGLLRPGDLLSRWGGEEFLLWLPEAEERDAVAVVQRLRDALRELPVPGAPPDYRITFSAGVAACGTAVDLEAAVECADQAMYRAKTAGRDRTVACCEPQAA